MFIRPTYIKSKGKRLAYWTLVESYRTEKGPRQRIVAYLGKLKESKRKGIKQAAEGNKPKWIQTQLFDDDATFEPEWIEVNVNGVRIENEKAFGGPWIAMELIKLLGLDDFLKQHLPPGEEQVSWSLTSLILIICRLLNPSSELHIAEHYYKSTALSDLLGVPDERVNDDRLYRGLDKLLPHKDALETYLKNKLGNLFGLEFDILLYDVRNAFTVHLAQTAQIRIKRFMHTTAWRSIAYHTLTARTILNSSQMHAHVTQHRYRRHQGVGSGCWRWRWRWCWSRCWRWTAATVDNIHHATAATKTDGTKLVRLRIVTTYSGEF